MGQKEDNLHAATWPLAPSKKPGPRRMAAAAVGVGLAGHRPCRAGPLARAGACCPVSRYALLGKVLRRTTPSAAARPAEESREPAGTERDDFPADFELRRVGVGTCGPIAGEDARVRFPRREVDPAAGVWERFAPTSWTRRVEANGAGLAGRRPPRWRPQSRRRLRNWMSCAPHAVGPFSSVCLASIFRWAIERQLTAAAAHAAVGPQAISHKLVGKDRNSFRPSLSITPWLRSTTASSRPRSSRARQNLARQLNRSGKLSVPGQVVQAEDRGFVRQHDDGVVSRDDRTSTHLGKVSSAQRVATPLRSATNLVFHAGPVRSPGRTPRLAVTGATSTLPNPEVPVPRARPAAPHRADLEPDRRDEVPRKPSPQPEPSRSRSRSARSRASTQWCTSSARRVASTETALKVCGGVYTTSSTFRPLGVRVEVERAESQTSRPGSG